MGDIVDFKTGKKFTEAPCAALCVYCGNRWIAYIMEGTPLFLLECPSCHQQKSFVSFLPPEHINETRDQ